MLGGENMPQVSLYIDEDVLSLARRNARIENISLSKYVTRALTKSADSCWPEGYWNLFGALADESFVCPEDTPFDKVATQVEFP